MQAAERLAPDSQPAMKTAWCRPPWFCSGKAVGPLVRMRALAAAKETGRGAASVPLFAAPPYTVST